MLTDKQQTAINKLIAYVCTCKKHNQPEWMAGLADYLNEVFAATGVSDRVRWPGKWASEFQFEIDSKTPEE